MEINIGVMCSCMPAFKPFFARVVPNLSLSKLSLPRLGTPTSTRRGTRSRPQETPENIDDAMLLELRRYRSAETNDRATTGHSSPVGPAVDGGVRNIIDF